MKDNIRRIGESFIANRDEIKKVYKPESLYIISVAANIITAAEAKADAERIKECKKLIRKGTGAFSYLRGTVEVPASVKLAMADDPEAMFKRISEIYEVLKKHFRRSEYLALTAMLLADTTSVEEADRLAARGRGIYDLMKKEHPLLTAEEDSVMAIYMAFSGKSDKDLIDDMEKCFGLLKKKFSDKDALQTVSHILAMDGGSPEEKAVRLTALFDGLNESGRKYSKYYELATLAALSLLPEDDKTLLDAMLEFDGFLDGQKGYGGLSIDKKTRLMHAAMLTADLYRSADTVNRAATASTLALIAAQQAALCAIIASTMAANAAASSN